MKGGFIVFPFVQKTIIKLCQQAKHVPVRYITALAMTHKQDRVACQSSVLPTLDNIALQATVSVQVLVVAVA